MKKSKGALRLLFNGKGRIECLLLLAFITLPFCSLNAQRRVDYAVHANIIYHFTKYIQWPEDLGTTEFVIGIVGDSPVLEELKKAVANKSIKSQKIVVRQFQASQKSFNCKILFLSQEESGSLKKVIAKTAGSPVLLVTEDEGLARRGACINFIIVAERLKLEINKKNLELRGLGIASELLQLGTIVK